MGSNCAPLDVTWEDLNRVKVGKSRRVHVSVVALLSVSVFLHMRSQLLPGTQSLPLKKSDLQVHPKKVPELLHDRHLPQGICGLAMRSTAHTAIGASEKLKKDCGLSL